MYLDLDFMRINAERERIKKYQEITTTGAYSYYKILKGINDAISKSTKQDV